MYTYKVKQLYNLYHLSLYICLPFSIIKIDSDGATLKVCYKSLEMTYNPERNLFMYKKKRKINRLHRVGSMLRILKHDLMNYISVPLRNSSLNGIRNEETALFSRRSADCGLTQFSYFVKRKNFARKEV